MREPANFGSHYVLTAFGCGTSCEMAFAVDKQTGLTAWLPFVVNSTETDADPLTFRRDSSVLVVKAQRGEETPGGEFYYELRGGRFVLLKAVRWKRDRDSPGRE